MSMAQTAVEDILADIEISKTHIMLAEVVKWFHICIVAFTGIGWMLPWPQAWQLHLLLVPVMKLHWLTNNGTCFFTTLEHKLRGNSKAGTTEQIGFIYRLTKAILGKYTPSENIVTNMSEFGMYICWVISALRLFVL
jgi:hypothetical protein